MDAIKSNAAAFVKYDSRLLAFTVSVLVLAETSHAQERPPIFQQMFKTYGFESFGQVEKIRYTFNSSSPD